MYQYQDYEKYYDVNQGYNTPFKDSSKLVGIIEPPFNMWLDMYWKAVHVMAQTYNPNIELSKQAMKCFYQSLSDILPSNKLKIMFHDFINMTSDVQHTLFLNKSLTKFFSVNKDFYDKLVKDPYNFFDYCLEKSDSLFIWTFLLHAYVSIMTNENIISFNSLRANFDRNNISKETWANPIWFVIHFSAYHAPNVINNQWAISYKSFISSLQYVIPCPICRTHLRENLPLVPIDNYINTKQNIFKWSVELHNIVNKSLDKPIISLDEAIKIYDPFRQGYVLQNSRYY